MPPMKRLILPALAALTLSACATEPTTFQPAVGPSRVGFSEMRIEPGRYRVIFQGGPGAPPAQVEDYALLRAADLAIAEGYDWFRVTQRMTQQNGYSGASLSLGFGERQLRPPQRRRRGRWLGRHPAQRRPGPGHLAGSVHGQGTKAP